MISKMTETPEPQPVEPTSRTAPLPVATPRENRLPQVAAWIAIVAGVLVIVAVVFCAGFFFGRTTGGFGGHHHHRFGDRPDRMPMSHFDRPGPPMMPGTRLSPPSSPLPESPAPEPPAGPGPTEAPVP